MTIGFGTGEITGEFAKDTAARRERAKRALSSVGWFGVWWVEGEKERLRCSFFFGWGGGWVVYKLKRVVFLERVLEVLKGKPLMFMFCFSVFK